MRIKPPSGELRRSGNPCGAGDIVIAGGVENMSHVPIGAGMNQNPKLLKMFSAEMYIMGMTAE
jgi:acetyl-CoA acetyltransferase